MPWVSQRLVPGVWRCRLALNAVYTSPHPLTASLVGSNGLQRYSGHIALVVYGFGLSGILASLGGLFAIDIAPKRVAGAAMGFIGIFSYLGAGMQDYISGRLIYDSEIRIVFWLGDKTPTVYFYDYSLPIIFWVGASVLSLILATTLWRVRARD